MIVFFDASALTCLIEGRAPFASRTRETLAELERSEPGVAAAISRLSWLECRAGPMRSGDVDALAAFDGFFARSDLVRVDLDRTVVELATAIRVKHGLRTHDALQAACCLQLGPEHLMLTGDAVDLIRLSDESTHRIDSLEKTRNRASKALPCPVPAMSSDLLDPKNDYVFKRLLADAPDLLASLINAVRFTRPPVEVVQVLNPAITARELGGKFIVLDVLAQDADGRRFDIEMQSRAHPAWSARSAYYLARTLTQQIDGGEDYEQLRAAIGIHLLDFQLFDDPMQSLWRFELRDERKHEVRLGSELELNMVELPKALGTGEAPPALTAWIEFFEHWQQETVMGDIDEPAVREAIERLQRLSADKKARRAAFVRERALRDERAARREERDKGREEGRAEGIQVGLAQGRLHGEAAVLMRMLSKRFGPLPDTIVRRIEAADTPMIERWVDRVLDARALGEVFEDGEAGPLGSKR